jgi:hypothetical protein
MMDRLGDVVEHLAQRSFHRIADPFKIDRHIDIGQMKVLRAPACSGAVDVIEDPFAQSRTVATALGDQVLQLPDLHCVAAR